jgi:brefeldin A-inhibited guanine nucleotide-exchange protein
MSDAGTEPASIPLPTSPPVNGHQGGILHAVSDEPEKAISASTVSLQDSDEQEAHSMDAIPLDSTLEQPKAEQHAQVVEDTASPTAEPSEPVSKELPNLNGVPPSLPIQSSETSMASTSSLDSSSNLPEEDSQMPVEATSEPHIPPIPSQGPRSPSQYSHRRSVTIGRGNTVSTVLISSALESIAASREAKRSAPLRESTQRALEHIRSEEAADARLIFEPLRLACETKNEKLMIISLDCISKLISYSFFAEPDAISQPFPSPPPSPRMPTGPSVPDSSGRAPQPALVDLVAHTITACHSETTPDTVSLQIVKALLSLVLSPTTLVHHSSLLKAVRTVYNVFLLSSDPVNQMVAQGGLTQMVHHVFTRCRAPSIESKTPIDGEYPNGDHRNGLFSPPTPDSVNGPRPQSRSGSASESTTSLNLPSTEEDQSQARTPQTAVTL